MFREIVEAHKLMEAFKSSGVEFGNVCDILPSG